MEKYHIVFFRAHPFADSGGVGRVTETLSNEFIERGASVCWVSLFNGRSKDIRDQHKLDLRAPTEKQVCQLEAHFDKKKINIVINQGGLEPVAARICSRIYRRSALVITVHHNSVLEQATKYRQIVISNQRQKFGILSKVPGFWEAATFRFRLMNGLRYRQAIRNSNKLVLLSEKFIPELSSYGVRDFSKVAAIPNPAPFETVIESESQKEDSLVFVGRIQYRQKRLDRLIRIWTEISAAFPQWKLDVIGDGQDFVSVKNACERRALSRITFHGWQDPRPYLLRSKFLCLTSDYEGYGMVLVEAMAHGTVPVSFRCFSGIGDIIEEGASGIVISDGDISAYVDALSHAMKDEASRKRMAQRAIEKVRTFSKSLVADRWEALFAELVQKSETGDDFEQSVMRPNF